MPNNAGWVPTPSITDDKIDWIESLELDMIALTGMAEDGSNPRINNVMRLSDILNNLLFRTTMVESGLKYLREEIFRRNGWEENDEVS